jgi:hypothetical protein
MPKRFLALRIVLLMLGLLSILALFGCGVPSAQSAQNFDSIFDREVKPYAFNYTAWEANAFSTMLKRKLSGTAPSSADEAQTVFNYFQKISQLEQLDSQMGQDRAMAQTAGMPQIEKQSANLRTILETNKAQVESIISRQISLALADSGIFNPVANSWLKMTFPPVSFSLQPSLDILVVSPRDKIERMNESVLRPDITLAQSDQLESTLESENVSALVIPLGGLGATYPSFVIESSDLKFVLAAVSEEWFHQYMAFRPIGFRYVLELTGTINDPDITALNETAVGIAAQEIGNLVFQRYYAAYYPASDNGTATPQTPQFDFNAAMRNIRANVDAFLAGGQVESAESYMEESRQMLISHGYFIRKLNQAYFAFYGSYTYSETSVDPLGDQIRQLRKNSPSLQAYIQTASKLTSRQQLLDYLASHEQ